MAFLDNSGDIILDAVLTDTGRMRLAQGDFNITYYGFGDDEINYALYRNANHSSGAHPSGSAYYDLDILQTPVLEAFTDNAANLKSRLVTYTNLTHLHLPILKINESVKRFERNTDSNQAKGKFVVTADEETSRDFKDATRPGIYKADSGVMKGTGERGTVSIRIDQGLDTEIPTPASNLSEELTETRYSIQIDNRLGVIRSASNATPDAPAAPLSFIDDDNIANYTVTQATESRHVGNITNKELVPNGKNVIKGPRGTTVGFAISAQPDLQLSNDLFQKMGTLSATWTDSGSTSNSNDSTIHYIDTIVRVRGMTTGYKIDIPVRFVKLAAARTMA
jgi:hypothetical protein